MKKLLVAMIVMMLLVTAACADGFNPEALEGLNVEEVHVSIPGCEKTYHIIWVSDLHIVIDNEEIAEEQHEFVKGRQTAWAIRPDGKEAGDFWVEELAEQINTANPDAILFGGDMLDLCSEATVAKLKEGLEKITVPYLYIRADHDDRTHWLKTPDYEKNLAMHKNICENEPIMILEYPVFIILGINNSTYQMTDEAVEQVKAVAKKGKPIIVITHVPYDSVIDRSLDEISRSAWQERNLTWGIGTSYVPNEKMQEWTDIVYGENTPVVEVLAGHLHLTWDGMIKENVHQHIFSPAFSGFVGLITVGE